MSSWAQMVRVLQAIGIYVLAVLVLLGVQLALQDIVPFPAALYLFGAAYLAALPLTLWWLWRAVNPRFYREAAATGLAAQARVLEATPTGWRLKRRKRLVGREYRMRLQIELPGRPAYETTLVAYQTLDLRKGAEIAVKVHPQQPEIVVLAQPITP